MLCLPLLLAGIAMSTYRIGESVSQNAITGMFPKAASMIGCGTKHPWSAKTQTTISTIPYSCHSKTLKPEPHHSHTTTSLTSNSLNNLQFSQLPPILEAAPLHPLNQKPPRKTQYSHHMLRRPHLVISSGVGQDQKPRLTERVLQLIREGTGSVPSSNSLAPRVLREFQHCTLTVWPCGLHDDVLRILNGGNHSRSQLQLLVGLPHVDDENACPPDRPHITLRNQKRIQTSTTS
jgi:hypothetical protein